MGSLGADWLASALGSIGQDFDSWPTWIKESFEKQVAEALSRKKVSAAAAESPAYAISQERAGNILSTVEGRDT